MAEPSLSLAKANSVFNLALYKTLSERNKTANIFYSPFSISSALAMVLLGARGNTAEEIARVLGFSKEDLESAGQQSQLMQEKQRRKQSGVPPADDLHAKFGRLLSELNKKDAPYALSIANRLYGEQTFLFFQEFIKEVEKNYKAALELVDFKYNKEEARVKINTWVEEKTQGNIKDLLASDDLDDRTKLVLVNAIYFNAVWESPFDRDETVDFTFRLNKNNTKKVKMMCQTEEFSHCYIPEVKLKVLEMPYKDGDLSMIILLPEDIEDDTTGLEKLEKELDKFEDWTRPDRMKYDRMNVKIPKFKLAETYDLNDVLQKMGMSDAFTFRSDLSGMSPVKDLVVSKVVHKAFVEVNEEGTEAAAATSVICRLLSACPEVPISFIADHPFLFFIRHNPSSSVLFAGRVCSPE
ncbi:leukocyte elastase inhibitor A-like [Halichoeres trimaculatus]|uniref:leukocyte elastase inhibitor A-like n=1 Tax=Halichoeres trimaculatus TaxID=147232 RepID=UPI003D9E3E80